jgi:hypothetical protein
MDHRRDQPGDDSGRYLMLNQLMRRLALLSALSLAACQPLSLGSPTAPASPPRPTKVVTPSPSPDDAVSVTPEEPMTNPTPLPQPFAPQPSDAKLVTGNAFIDSAEVIVAESFPPQYTLHLQGSLPTPCHQLRVRVSPPSASKQVAVEVYSVVDGNKVCAQVLQDFEARVPLGSFTGGPYQLLVNGEQVAELK